MIDSTKVDKEYYTDYEIGYNDGIVFAVSKLYVLPSVQPERESAEWVKNNNGTFSCSKCHSWIPKEQRNYARYCLYCGSRMKRRINE